ncbi:hypothetical protein GN244_ATG14052 [Phytophthora infestans]|uniref:WW domain-containing protein n=1 Tax=Phytophthora infestans TaxID=4787 RepID=A0A833S2Y9_PHYIN|nr:hypothetical protein GN244_ATG20119 [Phytophthora infestans]KAF4034002.1 hypothetical protein GN244_ATG14052 [Phytophthora infestans]
MRGASKSMSYGLLTPEKAVDVISRSFRGNQHWVPSKALSTCLSVPYQRLLVVTTPKDDLSNLIWTSVLVLVYCATHLVDSHESWYEVSDACTAWLRQQQLFVDQREDLVRSACNLLNVGDPDQLLLTLFASVLEPFDPAIAEENAMLLREGWQRCFLNEPPYSAYYWNAETNHSTWRHPLETAQMERDLQERKEKRHALLAKVLLLRLPINRDAKPPTAVQMCCECAVRNTKQAAAVLCLECGSKYFCDECCDVVHCDRIKRSHLASSTMRFRPCFGRAGFPKIEPRPRTPFMIYQEEQKRLQEEQSEVPIESNPLVI